MAVKTLAFGIAITIFVLMAIFIAIYFLVTAPGTINITITPV